MQLSQASCCGKGSTFSNCIPCHSVHGFLIRVPLSLLCNFDHHVIMTHGREHNILAPFGHAIGKLQNLEL